MKPIFLNENKHYTFAELIHFFESEDTEPFIQECLNRGIAQKKHNTISFQYVGIIIFHQQLILFLPKYLHEPLDHYNKIAKIKQIIRVLKIYSKGAVTEEELEFFGDFQQGELYNYFLAIDYFINDYIEYGLYNTDKIEWVLDGQGEVDWQQTIDYQFAYLSKEQSPIYLDLVTEEILTDQKHIIIEIHKAILNECSEYLTVTGIGELLDYPSVIFPTDVQLSKNRDYLLKKINDALYQDYNDRNLTLLNSMYKYISQNDAFLMENRVVFFGTRRFHTVWEKCCASVMGHDGEIVKNILKPVWTNFIIKDNDKDTLVPDILKKLCIYNMKLLLIIDAKYYDLSFTNFRVVHNPGIQDVIKQYMYEKALHSYIESEKIDYWFNLFLFPTSSHTKFNTGEVSISFLSELKNINLIKLPAEEIFEKYITFRKWNNEDWEIFINVIKTPSIVNTI
ncbi:LlaJI family restriction endonuclease [Rossellomorea sp. GAMAL-10_SWC]